MRIAVIRGDLPKAISLSGLEPTSQFNPDIEPPGQELNLARPDVTRVEKALSTVSAAIDSTANITFPLTLTGSNNVLRAKTSTGASFTVVTVTAATYNAITDLVAAVNTALNLAGLDLTASQGSTAVRLRLSTVAGKGVGSAVILDTTANGSNFNAAGGFSTSGVTFQMATGANIILATVPVGGPIDVSTPTLTTYVGTGLSTKSLTSFTDLLAPRLYATSVVRDSFRQGALKLLLSASYCPDVRQGLATGAAVAVVQDDGVSAYVVPGLPTVSAASLSGDLTITGTDLGSIETDDTVVTITGPNGKVVYQQSIAKAGGKVTATQIVVPAALIAGVVGGGSTNSVKVRHRSFMSNTFPISLS